MNIPQIMPASPSQRDPLNDPNTFFAWQRNHMANERTFLAWCRTGIAFFIFSFVIERLDFLLRRFSPLLGQEQSTMQALRDTRVMSVAAFLTGVLVVAIAAWRFYSLRRQINERDRQYSAMPSTVFLLVLVGMVVSMASFLAMILFL